MIRLADYDVYATDEGLFLMKQGENNVTRVARPKDMHHLSDDLAAAWRDVQGTAGNLPAAPTKSPDKPVRRSKSTGDYDLGSSSEKTTTGSKSHGDYDPTEDQCKDCGSSNVSLSEGCITCMECGWSKCG